MYNYVYTKYVRENKGNQNEKERTEFFHLLTFFPFQLPLNLLLLLPKHIHQNEQMSCYIFISLFCSLFPTSAAASYLTHLPQKLQFIIIFILILRAKNLICRVYIYIMYVDANIHFSFPYI